MKKLNFYVCFVVVIYLDISFGKALAPGWDDVVIGAVQVVPGRLGAPASRDDGVFTKFGDLDE